MPSVIDILEHIEQASGKGSREEKVSTLERHKGNELLKAVFKAAQDPFIVYYVTKVKAPLNTSDARDDDEMLDHFIYDILPQLSGRIITGNAAKAMVQEVIGAMTSLQQKWCQRILLKNLRCGVQESTVNEVWPGLIPTFEVALAETLKAGFIPGEGIVIKGLVSYPIRVEPKLDGHRLVAVKHDGKVTLYTRNGNEVDTLPTIITSLQRSMPDETIFDGESIGQDWNETSSVMSSSKNAKDDSGMVYNVFDSMTYSDWISKTNAESLWSRTQATGRHVATVDSPVVKHVNGIIANTEQELLEFYRKCLDEGYEGVMLKKLDRPYVFDRSDAVLKLKPETTYEGTIVGHYEGRPGTKNEGRFGGFHVVLSNGVVTRVGNGFNDKIRADIQLEGPDAFIRRIMEVKAQPDPLTKDGLTVDGKARFPVFKRFRNPEDVAVEVIQAGQKWLEAQG
jgi:hypothetical protein